MILYHIWPILYHTYSTLTSKYQIPTFTKNQPSSLGCYFWEIEPFFELVMFQCFRPNPYTRMGVLTIGAFSFFCKIVKTHCKTKVEPWICGFPLIWESSLYFNYLSRITFGGWGPPSRAPWRGHAIATTQIIQHPAKIIKRENVLLTINPIACKLHIPIYIYIYKRHT